MKVLVSDSSILIEFLKQRLLGRMFQLEFEFAVPDLLFHEELIDLGAHTRSDLLALALAAHHGWHLLTEDRAMRSVADSKGIAHRDALWIIDNLLDAGILSASQVVAALEAMRDDPRCPVPKSGLAVRLGQLRD